MKALFILLGYLSLIPVSIVGMIYGWGLHAENWGWITFSYFWMMIVPVLIGLSK